MYMRTNEMSIDLLHDADGAYDAHGLMDSLDDLFLHEDWRHVMTDYEELKAVLDGRVFQDGVLLPVRSPWIAPFGAVLATCNLSGASRFALNVSRGNVDESPRVLRNWAETVGVHVQRECLRRIQEEFRKQGIDCTRECYFSRLASQGPLQRESQEVARQLLEGIKKK